MSSDFALMQRRFGNLRPGMSLIAVEEAALPVTVVHADVLAQERVALPIIEQFVLRFTSAGLRSSDAIANMLGIGEDLVLDAAASQVSVGNLVNRGREELALTPGGLEAARDLAATRPVLKPLPVVFDRLNWELADHARNSLLLKKDAEALGLVLLPAARKSRIGLDDVTAESINALLRRRGRAADQIEILRVRKVSPNTHRYLQVQLLVFGDKDRQEVSLAVCLNDELSEAHTQALDAVDAVAKLGLTIAPETERVRVDEDLEKIRVDSAEVERILTGGSQVAGLDGGHADAHPPDLRTMEVRAVSVFEHPDLLVQALTEARKRLLLIAPWVRNSVVTTDFLGNLEGRLRAGVTVTIAHGYGKDDSGSDTRALDRLENLRKRYPKSFDLARLSDNHAKILIFDDTWINTSFNWLSFRGDPDRTYRMEEGTLVRIRDRVNETYERYLRMVEDLRRR